MDPKDYNGEEWKALLREFTPRQMRNSIKSAYRGVANMARKVAISKLQSSGLECHGASDFKKGIRQVIYSRGGGFLITVRGYRGKSMHRNRRGELKPVLMWAEDGAGGTDGRSTRSKSKFFVRISKGHSTGSMPKFGFMEEAEPTMASIVEKELYNELVKAVHKTAAKCGFNK